MPLPIVLKQQDPSKAPRWRHYFVVDTDTVSLVEMVPMMIGWKIRRIDTAPMSRDWPGMTRAQVVGWNEQHHAQYGLTRCEGSEASRVVHLLKTHEPAEAPR